MKIIKVRIGDDVSSNYWGYVNEIENYFKPHAYTKRNANRLTTSIVTKNPVDKKAVEHIAAKYFKNYKISFKDDPAALRLHGMSSYPLEDGTYHYNINMVVNPEELPATAPRKKYETSKIDVKKAEEAAREINKKYPIGKGIRSRAAVGKKKGQFFIDVEVWNGPEEDKFDKDTFLPIIKKYFPKEKIRVYGANHSRMGFFWYSYKYYILEQ